MREADPIEARNDAVHRRVAERIRRDSSVIAEATKRLERWLGERTDPNPALLEWRAAIKMLEPSELADFLESDTPRAKRMRVSSPFFGLDQ
jgi:hypothetical protein